MAQIALVADVVAGIETHQAWKQPPVRLGLGVAFAGLYAMQFFDHHSLGMLALLAVFAIVLTLAAVLWLWATR